MKQTRTYTVRDAISKIVYSTIKKWQESKKFSERNLKSYDNWKDDLIDKLVKYTEKGNKEHVKIMKGLKIYQEEQLKNVFQLPTALEEDAKELNKIHKTKLGRKGGINRISTKAAKKMQQALKKSYSVGDYQKLCLVPLKPFKRANVKVQNW